MTGILEICFVVLHYIVYKETIRCVDSIKKNIDSNDYKIVVVDNASPNSSGIILEEKYKNDEFVNVILMENNLGFAKGNNAGIDFCKEKYLPDFICCLNNDVRLVSHDFMKQVKKEYGRSKCAVMGPQIYLKNNDLFSFNVELKDVQYYKNLKSFYQSMGSSKGNKDNRIARQEVLRKIKLLNFLRGFVRGMYFRKENVMLHGCALIFTPRFFRYFNGFNDKTFLYLEEQLLFHMCRKRNLKTIYNPKIVIKHMEDQATNAAWGKNNKKNKYMIDSLGVLIEEMEKKNE